VKTKKQPLPAPAAAASDAEAVEFIRAWKAGDAMRVALKHDAWRQPEAGGIALADIVRPFADACEKSQGWPRKEIIKQVAAMFQTELKQPADKPEGGFVRK
jgi:hypothetical protein